MARAQILLWAKVFAVLRNKTKLRNQPPTRSVCAYLWNNFISIGPITFATNELLHEEQPYEANQNDSRQLQSNDLSYVSLSFRETSVSANVWYERFRSSASWRCDRAITRWLVMERVFLVPFHDQLSFESHAQREFLSSIGFFS